MIRKVLLVDDEADIRAVATLSLGAVGGWQVLTANAGDVAVELAARERPDVVLLDVMLPGLDGVETQRRLRADPRTADIPVIFLTARTHAEDRARYAATGALGVIEKPFDPMKLPALVRALVEGA